MPIVAAVLFLTVLASLNAQGKEPPNVDKAIKVALRGRDVIAIEPTSAMGKRLSDWRDSLPISTAFSIDGTDYAISKLVLFPDGTRINIHPDGTIVYRQTSRILSPQKSAKFEKEDAHLVKIRSLLVEIEKGDEEPK